MQEQLKLQRQQLEEQRRTGKGAVGAGKGSSEDPITRATSAGGRATLAGRGSRGEVDHPIAGATSSGGIPRGGATLAGGGLRGEADPSAVQGSDKYGCSLFRRIGKYSEICTIQCFHRALEGLPRSVHHVSGSQLHSH